LSQPLSEAQREIIRQNVVAYEKLSDSDRQRLEDDSRLFVAEKRWDVGAGMMLSDELKFTVAAQACLMVLGFEDRWRVDRFANVRDVVVLESAYRNPMGRDRQDAGPQFLGHTSLHGAVVLAWDAVRHGGREPRDGRNLVFHEFAHKLDLTDGVADGTPVLQGQPQMKRWVDVMSAAYEQLCDRAERGRATLLDEYGATNPAEFFAVASECFFEKPGRLKRRHAELYEVLSSFYRQDPA